MVSDPFEETSSLPPVAEIAPDRASRPPARRTVARRYLALVVVCLCAWPSQTAPQVIPGPPPSAAACRAGIAALKSGETPGELWFRLAECGSRGISALESALLAARTSVDTTYLEAPNGAASRGRHRAFFEAARAIATDPSASDEARLTGLFLRLPT